MGQVKIKPLLLSWKKYFLLWFVCLHVPPAVLGLDVNRSHGKVDTAFFSQPNNNSVRSHGPDHDNFDKLVDDFTTEIFIVAQYLIIGSIVNIFGIVTNIINIIVFVKQGLGDSINISLLGLSVSDLCSLIMLQCLNIWFCPYWEYSGIPINFLEVASMTAGWPRMAFTRVTAWITAFITFERCICIALPLKVKMIITPDRTVAVIASFFVIIFVSVAPQYYTTRLVWLFSPQENRTLLGLSFTEDRQAIDKVVFGFANVCLPILAFIIVVVCTIILTVKLNSKSKWRESSASKAEQVTNKDKKIVKLVTFISTIFIICFFPNAIVFAFSINEPELNLDGKYRNAAIVAFSFIFLLESINSSINIFLYLRMSSKFRETFNHLFHKTSALSK